MHRNIENFIDEIRRAPGFITASQNSAHWLDHLFAIERGLDALCRDCRSEVIEIVDRIQGAVARKSLPLNERLLELEKLFVQARDLGRSVH